MQALIQSNHPANAPAVTEVAPDNPSRRAFLKAGLLATGGAVFGFQLPMARKARAAASPSEQTDKDFPVQGWLQLTDQGDVILIIPVSEMGQGSQASLAMILADELGADYHRIQVKAPLNDPMYNNPMFGMQLTGGSTAVRAWWQPLSKVGATLRAMLCQAAADTWQIQPGDCDTRESWVIERHNHRRIAFEKLIPTLSGQVAPAKPSLRDPDDYQYIGRPMPRVDTLAKLNRQAQFGMDVQLPGLLTATLAQAPVFGGEIQNYDEAAAKSVKGVKAVVELPNAIAVVAEGYWPAKKGLEKLNPQFGSGTLPELDNQTIENRLNEGLLKDGETVKASDGATSVASVNQMQADYFVPYLAHTPMEPMNATAHVTDTHCEVWAPTQNQTQSVQAAADASLLQTDQVTLHTTYLGGGFGRRAYVDYVTQAVLLSTEMQAPVKLIWSREEDVQHDYYRPAALARFEVKLDAQGYPLAWHNKVVTDSVMADFTGGSDTMIDSAMTEGLGDQAYQIPNLSLHAVRENFPVPIGFWRSVGHSFTGFFLEGMLNELAYKADTDPFAYRRHLLKDDARMHGVLDQLETLSNWGSQPAEGIGRGIACVESFGSFAGEAVEARIENGEIVVDKVYCVIDCGRVVNPEIVRRQVSSAVIYGLTAALQSEIHFENGRVVESNFDDYPMLTLAQTPEIVVEIVDSDQSPGGYGEPGLPPLAPALAAAIGQLTGEPVRRLPIQLTDSK